MSNLKCPVCKNNITFLEFIKSLTPYNIKCRKCKTKLKLNKGNFVVIIISLIYGVVIASILENLNMKAINFIVIVILGGIIYEMILYYIIKKYFALIVK